MMLQCFGGTYTILPCMVYVSAVIYSILIYNELHFSNTLNNFKLLENISYHLIPP